MGNVILQLMTAACLIVPNNPQPDLKLWYTEPAKEWTQALPIGNGRLGAYDLRRDGGGPLPA